jgi:hypothetical protein
MKRHVLRLLAVGLVFGLALAGCKDGPNESDALIGVWGHDDGGGESLTFTETQLTIMTKVEEITDLNGVYTWSVSGGELTYSKDGSSRTESYKISGDTLSINIFGRNEPDTFQKGWKPQE